MEAKENPWILVLEDDEDDLTLTLRALRKIDPSLHVEAATDGEAATDKMLSLPRPRLVLMDAHLPKVSGHEVLRRAKLQDHLVGVPFVVFSSSIGPSEAQAFREQGADEVVTKPMEYEEYASVLRQVLARYVTLI